MSKRFFEVVKDEHRKHPNVEIKLPQAMTEKACAYDLFLPIDITLEPFKPTLVPLDIKASFGADEVLLINVRSSMGKIPVMIPNCQGWIDADYYSNPDNDGNIGMMLLNLSENTVEFKAGDRIGQAMFMKFLKSDIGNSTTQRQGGFGSTNA